MSNTLEIAKALLQRPSITPNDAGCQDYLAEQLQKIGFNIQKLPFADVSNLWARRGNTQPLFVFAGHTDVVPTGKLENWQFPPFTPTVDNGLLYGRGAADMKGSIAAMITAIQQFIAHHPNHPGTIALLITGDEEGIATNGTVKVIEYLQQQGEQIDYCLVGEPTSIERLGDEIKNGRRGSLNGKLTLYGKQGHAAYPQRADNPIHRFAPLLATLCQTQWDQGNSFFPPTTFQITNINAGTGADNVIPGQLELLFNFRYSSEVTHTQLQQQITTLLETHQLNYQIQWRHSGSPYLTTPGTLLTAAQQAITEICGYPTRLSTAGGTSDGRFIAPTGAQVLELGPLNATIHQINECVSIADLEKLSLIYQKIIEKLLLK